jgi:hypothetical protein
MPEKSHGSAKKGRITLSLLIFRAFAHEKIIGTLDESRVEIVHIF